MNTSYNREAVELGLYIDIDYTSCNLVQDALATPDKHAGPEYDDGRAIPFMEPVVARCARRWSFGGCQDPRHQARRRRAPAAIHRAKPLSAAQCR